MVNQETKSILRVFLLALIATLLSSCMPVYSPSVVVENLTLSPDGTGHIVIRIYSLNGLQSLQVGPDGRFTFDASVIQVKGIEGINGFQVFTSQIDNAKGRALFAAGYPGGSRDETGIVQIEVEARGSVGRCSSLEITKIDVLADSDGNNITRYEIINGTATVGSQ